MRKRKVVVVGAGPGGLAAAMQLAHAGADVTVLEAKSTVGGRCSTISENGFKFDTGPTFYLYPRILKEIFQSVGKDIDTEIPMKRLDPQYRVAFGAGGHLDCTPDLDEMDRQIAKLSPEDVGQLRKYMNQNGKVPSNPRKPLQRFGGLPATLPPRRNSIRKALEIPRLGTRELLP